MLSERAVVRVGMEIEVPTWKTRSRNDVVQELVDNNYLLGTVYDWTETHRYHCNCALGCGSVRRGNVVFPPVLSMCYDASLPTVGAEFITSPILFLEGLEPLREPWDIVSRDAHWTTELRDRNGGWCSPSVHLHVSALAPGVTQTDIDNGYATTAGDMRTEDIDHALALYVPEFFALADVVDMSRGLEYRAPYRAAGHHGYIHIRRFDPTRMVYIEWRLFEAAYDDWEYIESSAYMSAALTRALLRPEFYSQLMATGYAQPFHGDSVREATAANSAEDLIALVDETRLRVLREACMEELDDDLRGRDLVGRLFDRAEERL